MTGKELVLVMVGAATAAGAGGLAAARVMGSAPAPQADQTALLERLDGLAGAIEDTNSILDESRREIGGLRSRMEAVEAGLHGAPAMPSTTPSGRRRVDVSRHGATTVEEDMDGRVVELGDEFDAATHAEAQAALQEALAGMQQRIRTSSPQIGTLLSGDNQVIELSGALDGLRKSFELRNLPEEERWQRARDEVGLNDVQVDEIKSALEERDKAIDESMQVERDDEDGNNRLTVRRMDFQKTREANEAYRKRVDNVLNDQQKKAWKDGGYENAFGRGAMGSATIISVSTTQTGEPTKTR